MNRSPHHAGYQEMARGARAPHISAHPRCSFLRTSPSRSQTPQFRKVTALGKEWDESEAHQATPSSHPASKRCSRPHSSQPHRALASAWWCPGTALEDPSSSWLRANRGQAGGSSTSGHRTRPRTGRWKAADRGSAQKRHLHRTESHRASNPQLGSDLRLLSSMWETQQSGMNKVSTS